MGLRDDIQHAINCNSAENGSDTPDFILAEFLENCLLAFDKAMAAREKWYGRSPRAFVSGIIVDPPEGEAANEASPQEEG